MKINTEKIQGLKLSIINNVIILITCILAFIIFIFTIFAAQSYKKMRDFSEEYKKMENHARIVREASDYLTDCVHKYVITGRIEYLEAYFEEANVTKRREAGLDELATHKNVNYDDVHTSVNESKRLMKREYYAMKLAALSWGHDLNTFPKEVREISISEADIALTSLEKLEKSRQMVHDTIYMESKEIIYQGIDSYTKKLLTGLQKEVTDNQSSLETFIFLIRISLFFLVCLNVLTAVIIVFLVMKPLQRFLVNISEKSMLSESGAYEFKHLARTYNQIYREKEELDHEKELFQYKSEHDLMTGLFNRIAAENRIRTLVDEGKNPGTLLLIDLDDLKGINDTYGHEEGDKAILGIANTLKETFKETDIIGRLGGDEFIAYLPNSAKHTAAVSRKLTALLRNLSRISVGGADQRSIHCSIGCAVQDSSHSSFDILYKEADTALYQVKRNGKNHFLFYLPEMNEEDYQFQKQLLLTQTVTKFTKEEMQELLTAIATFYQLALCSNLSKNNYFIMQLDVEGSFSKLPSIGSLDPFTSKVAEDVHPEDLQGFKDTLYRENLLKAYHEGQKIIRHHFRLNQPEGYRLVETNVIFYVNESGDVCDFSLMRWANESRREPF